MKLFPSIRPVIHPVQLKVFYDSPILLLLQQSPPSSWERKPQDVDPGAAAEAVSSLFPWSAVCCYLTVTSSANIKIFSGQGPHGYMRNVVYREVLEIPDRYMRNVVVYTEVLEM